MFGNQQNEAKEIKKRGNPELAEENVDTEGEVIAHEPVDIKDIEEPVDDLSQETVDEMESEFVPEETAEEKEEEEEALDTESNIDDKIELGNDEDNTALEAADGDIPEMGYQEYLKELSKSEKCFKSICPSSKKTTPLKQHVVNPLNDLVVSECLV